MLNMPPIPLPPGLSIEDVIGAGIPVMPAPTGAAVILPPHATSVDRAALEALIERTLNPELPDPEEQAALTNAWLTVKACLDALPPAPGEGDDPYAVSRSRLVVATQAALDALNTAGGPG